MVTFDEATLSFYAKEAPVYVASGKNGISRHLESFLAQLVAGSEILELGCGGGRDAEFMIAQGFLVDPTDGTPEIAAKASERLKRHVRVMRFDELNALERYDAVYASASLLHVPVDQLSSVLSRVYQAFRSGGKHFASFKAGGVAARDRYGRYFNYLSRDQAEQLYLASAPWAFIQIDEAMGGGYDGVQGPWLQVAAVKN